MPKPLIKNAAAIEKMRVAGKAAAAVLEMIEPFIKPGVSTNEINTICHNYIVDTLKAVPAPLNYHGFPKSICTSVNQVVCHGIPNDKPLKQGDILNVDVTVITEGFHGDTSKMFVVGGETSILAKRLIEITSECLWRGINLVKPGTTLGDIGHAIQSFAEKQGFTIVREYCGHGIGEVFHEDSIQVLHYGMPGTGLLLQPGMTFTIEPMLNAGQRHVKVLSDGWTVATKDRSLSAQWEHTVLVTETGVEVLTLRKEEA